tara:strand:- start:1282 stop:1629 length:348 start_codon:yes stop_codon:yes gene_type:complete
MGNKMMMIALIILVIVIGVKIGLSTNSKDLYEQQISQLNVEIESLKLERDSIKDFSDSLKIEVSELESFRDSTILNISSTKIAVDKYKKSKDEKINEIKDSKDSSLFTILDSHKI